jgi:hydroxyacylglutathione hydrolase
MEIITIEAGPLMTNIYLAIDEETKKAVIIDAPMDCTELIKPYIDKMGLEVSAILLTHTHWDHAADTVQLKDFLNVQVYVHEADEFRLIDPNGNSIFPLPFDIPATKADHYLYDTDIIKFGNTQLTALHTPGHTEGGLCFYDKDSKILFSGDTIFRESIGRIDLPGGSLEKIAKSIKEKLLVLDDETQVFPGHGPSTTIGYERHNNPFFREMGIV